MTVLLLMTLATAMAPDPKADGTALGLVDLAAYRAALEAPEGIEPAAKVSFRDLWDHPERYEGHRVRVEGRIVRRFRQGPVGTFPALVEAWTRDGRGNLLCLVFPDLDATASTPGRTIGFEGTYLKRLRYPGGDVERLAPLIVGHRPPSSGSAGMTDRGRDLAVPSGGSGLDGIIALVLAGAVGLVLAVQSFRRPAVRPIEVGPPPNFRDGPNEGDDDDGRDQVP